MDLTHCRSCPMCDGQADRVAFPYSTTFNHKQFHYVRCAQCTTVYVDPVPDAETFSKMYAKSQYHDCHYENAESEAYGASARMLRTHLPAGAAVLDYGCGVGEFLKALRATGLEAFGVEFDSEAAATAATRSGCTAISVNEFLRDAAVPKKFHAIHVGDVLEHLPDPKGTFQELLRYLKPGGLLFVEGPLETNPSPVYWSARLFGGIKHRLRPETTGSRAPTHLLRTNAKVQRQFFARVDESLACAHWDVYETGWPYSRGGQVKRTIARLAIRLGGANFMGFVCGNRFRSLFRYGNEEGHPQP